MSYVARKLRENVTAPAASAVSAAASSIHKVTGAAYDVISDTAKKVGKTVEQIAKDPKMLAAIAISVAYPGAGAALGQALGLGSTTGAIIGNTLINTALNGGDLKKGLQSAVANYAGVVVGGMAKEIVSGGSAGSFLASKAGLVDMAVKNAVTAAIKGQNVQATITATVMNAAVAESTSKIPGFSDLPQAAKTAISSSIAQSLQGKNLDAKQIFGDAAMSALVNYGLTQISGYDELDPKYKSLAATTVAAALRGKDLTANTINWALAEANRSLSQAIRDDKEKQAISEGWKNYPEKLRAQSNGYATAEEYYASLNPKPAEPVHVPEPAQEAAPEQKEETPQTETPAQEESAPQQEEETPVEKPSEEQPPATEEVTPKQIDTEERFLQPSETPAPEPVQPQAPDPDAQAKSEGWKSEEEKDWAATLGYTDPSTYQKDVTAQEAGWKNDAEKVSASEAGFSDSAAYRQNIADMQAGFDSTADRAAAEARGITDAAEWDLAKQEDAAKAEGWAGLEQKHFAESLGFGAYKDYNQHVLDEDARAAGFVDNEERTNAAALGIKDSGEWKQFLSDQEARSLGFDDQADQKDAMDAGFKDSAEWNTHQEENRIVEFYNDKLGRDPTPEELQALKGYIGGASNPEDFTDEQIINTIEGGINATDYVYGPDGTRYDSAEDAIANNVFDYTDSWGGPVYGSDGNQYASAEDAMANGVFDFSGVKPEDFVEPETPEAEQPEQGEVVEGGPVWGPDGTEYASAADAMADGVFNFTHEAPVEQPEEPTTEEPVTDPEEPIVWEEDGEEPPAEEPQPEEPIVWEEDGEEPTPEEPDVGPEEPIVWEEDGEEAVTCEPGFHDDGTGLCVPDEETDTQDEQVDCGVGFHLNEDGVCESDDIPEETVCEPGFHDDGTGLCVADDEEAPEEDCGVGFHLNADGVCESDDVEEETTGGGTTGGGTTTTRRQQILQTLAKKAISSPGFQTQVQSPLADVQSPVETVSEAPVKKKPFQQLGGTSIYPTRFRSVLEDYLSGIKPPEEFSVDGSAPVDVLNQPSTIEQYREPDMATSTYFNYGQTPDLTELARLQQEQDAPLGEGLPLPTAYAQGGMVAPLLMARGGTGHGKNAHGALSIVEHSGKHRIDYRQGDAVTGAGDGQSDDIPAMLADGEFVIPADVVAALGNGSTKAGSDKLYEMMHNIRKQHRAAKPKDLPPPARKSPLDYLKKGK